MDGGDVTDALPGFGFCPSQVSFFPSSFQRPVCFTGTETSAAADDPLSLLYQGEEQMM
jgi:hypothetical protein